MKTIRFRSLLGLLFCAGGICALLLLPQLSQAQPLCVPYVPSVTYETRSGNIPGGGPQCITDSFSVPFPGQITPSSLPLVTLAGWEFRFTDDDQSYGLGAVQVTSVAPSGNSVLIDTRVCFRDQDTGNPRYWSYTLAIGAWLNQ